MQFFSGERIVPNLKKLRFTFLRHEIVYKTITSITKNRIVIDCACGEGYGSSLLTKVATKVTGIDLSPETILLANNKYKRNNIQFQVVDLEKTWPYDSNIFDIATSFQTIEHLSKPKEMLQSIWRVLKDDGIAIISTPNSKTFSPTGDILDPYHYQEYDHGEFKKLLTQIFAQVKIYSLSGNQNIQRLLKRDISTAKKFVKYDIFNLRTHLPNYVKRFLYTIMLNIIRRIQNDKQQNNIQLEDFYITDQPIDENSVLDLIAVCGKEKSILPDIEKYQTK